MRHSRFYDPARILTYPFSNTLIFIQHGFKDAGIDFCKFQFQLLKPFFASLPILHFPDRYRYLTVQSFNICRRFSCLLTFKMTTWQRFLNPERSLAFGSRILLWCFSVPSRDSPRPAYELRPPKTPIIKICSFFAESKWCETGVSHDGRYARRNVTR